MRSKIVRTTKKHRNAGYVNGIIGPAYYGIVMSDDGQQLHKTRTYIRFQNAADAAWRWQYNQEMAK